MSSTTLIISSTTATVSATASCITATPDKNGYVPESACNANYSYYPSFAAAVAFTVLFFITTSFHIFQAFYHKKLRLCWVVIMGASWELASFAIRSVSTKMQQNTALVVTSSILVLLAPIWVNAFVYMVLGRMIYFFVPEQKIWGVKGVHIAKIFVWLDILSFLTQAAGGMLIQPGTDQKTLLLGIHIYMGGIGLQEFCILIFTAIAVRFFIVMQTREKSIGVESNQILDQRHRHWRPLLYVMFASLVLITIRIIYRLVEYQGGLTPSENPIPFHEWYSLVLDALPMFLACGLMNVVHPGRVLVGEGSEFPRLSRKEKKEAKRVRREEKLARKEEMRGLKGGKAVVDSRVEEMGENTEYSHHYGAEST
ncbi:hypothetical protein ACMFMG_010498 [Clarireedia jacksonii]